MILQALQKDIGYYYNVEFDNHEEDCDIDADPAYFLLKMKDMNHLMIHYLSILKCQKMRGLRTDERKRDCRVVLMNQEEKKL